MTLVNVPYVERCYFACLLPRTSWSVIFFGGRGQWARKGFKLTVKVAKGNLEFLIFLPYLRAPPHLIYAVLGMNSWL